MTFWQKIKQAFRSFMYGRNGADHLSMALLWTGLICYLLGGIVGSIAVSVIFPVIGILLNLTGFAAYMFSLFRVFSRNVEKRRAENRRYVTMTEKRKTQRRQAKSVSRTAKPTSISNVPAARHGCASPVARA